MPPSCSLGLDQEVSYNKREDAEILLQTGEGCEQHILRKPITPEIQQLTRTHTHTQNDLVRKYV